MSEPPDRVTAVSVPYVRLVAVLAPLWLGAVLGACGGEGNGADVGMDTRSIDDGGVIDVPVGDAFLPDAPGDTLEDAGPRPFGVSDLLVAENPANPLSFFVSWRTERPVSTALRVTCGEQYLQDFHGELEMNEHEVFVMGLAAGWDCDFIVHPDELTTGITQETVEDVGPLWEELPPLDVRVLDEAQMAPGWTLLTLASAVSQARFIVAAVDPQGRYRWLADLGTAGRGAGAEIQVIDAGVLVGNRKKLILSWEGKVLWELRHAAHHDMRLSPFNDGHVLFLGRSFDGCATREGTIVEVNMETQEIIWQWHVCHHWTPRLAYRDWSHLNTVEPVPGERAVLISSRDQDLIYKVNRDTDEIEWTLGMDGDFEMSPEDWFLRQHTPEIQPDGQILILDNGLTPGEAERTGLDASFAREYTRAVEYRLTFHPDGTPDRAEAVWEYKDESIFALNRSEADRLENQNTLIHYVWVEPDQKLILREVTKDGQIVWDAWAPRGTSSYRSERIAPYWGHVVEPE